MAADPLDVLSSDEAKRLVSISASNTDQDAELEVFITAVSRRLDELVGPIVVRTFTAEPYNGGCLSIRLLHAPVSSFTTVTEYNGTTAQVLTAETNAAKTANNYLWDSTLGRLYRRASGNDAYFPAGRKNVTVTYVAGRAATTAAVDEKYKRAAGIILAHLWRADRGSGSETFGEYSYPVGFAIPNRALEILGDELRAPLIA
jgi:hypothetical protein